MKRLLFVCILLFSLSFNTLAIKDVNAWKQEKSLEQQFQVFKENLNFWSGNYFMSPAQLDQFYGAMTDTIAKLQQQVSSGLAKINQQKQELAAKQATVDETQLKLDESIRNQNSISVLGARINKAVYSTTMYLFIAGVLVLAGVMYMMFQRSHKVTRQTKKEYDELKAEYEEHKKVSLDRYTKINMELHKTRLELQKK
ncbi:hypothetical protein [Maribellus sp. YY47]|uniref:hypothetical protein n=1 Tax=Maribellus sp. YY47 TaxID=2929486 RepID=UPI00200152CE|nr:hypothetical protein [Maribellus sp. YY47]MCK3684625.1 hypothetical protein [Maribellus sp. YY47]